MKRVDQEAALKKALPKLDAQIRTVLRIIGVSVPADAPPLDTLRVFCKVVEHSVAAPRGKRP